MIVSKTEIGLVHRNIPQYSVALIPLLLGKNPTPYSVMRWFHVIEKGGPASANRSQGHINTPICPEVMKKRKVTGVNFPMKLKVTHRKFRQFNLECE